MLRNLLLTVVLVCLPSYSYSESITPYFGTTGNAASVGNTWSMDNVLPTPPGLDINGVFYKYTPQKETEADMKVHIGNENANGVGYLWRETDDWSGAQGGIEIRKVIGIANVPRELWGDGSIEVEGEGTVEDATVIYSYKVDPCYDPQFSPSCPGYQLQLPDTETVDIDLYDATADDAVIIATAETDSDIYEDEEESEQDEESEEEKEMRLEKALAAVDELALFNDAFAQNLLLDALNNAIQMNAYYAAQLRGGEYKETVVLVDKELPENKKGLRNGLAQQILHEEMISMQYNK